MGDHGRNVPRLHPTLGAPPFVLDLLRRQMLGGHHRSRAVVLFHALNPDQVARAEVFCHRRAVIRRGMLNVGPVHILAGELQVGLMDSRVSSGLPTISPPTTYILFLFRKPMARSVALPARWPPSRNSFLAAAFRNTRSSSRMFSMPRKT